MRLHFLCHLFKSNPLEFLFLLKFLKLLCLLLDRILQSLDAEGGLGLCMVFRRFDFLHFFEVLLKIALVQSLYLADRFFTDIDLLSELVDLYLFCCQQLLACLSLLVHLHDPSSKSLKVFKHYKPLHICQCFLSALVEHRWSTNVSKCGSYNALHTLGGDEFLFHLLNIWHRCYTFEI